MPSACHDGRFFALDYIGEGQKRPASDCPAHAVASFPHRLPSLAVEGLEGIRPDFSLKYIKGGQS